MQSFYPHWAGEQALGPEHFRPKREKAHAACAGLIASRGNIFSCLQLSLCSFCLRLFTSMALSQTPSFHYFKQEGRAGVLLLPHKRGTHRPTGPHQLHRHEGHLRSTRGQGPLRKLPLLFLHLSKGHSGLDCVVFSLTTPAPRFRGQKCLDFCSGG